MQQPEKAKLLQRGECGGKSCTPEMEDKMQPLARCSTRELKLMSRGAARNERVIRKPNLFS